MRSGFEIQAAQPGDDTRATTPEIRRASTPLIGMSRLPLRSLLTSHEACPAFRLTLELPPECMLELYAAYRIPDRPSVGRDRAQRGCHSAFMRSKGCWSVWSEPRVASAGSPPAKFKGSS